MSVQPSPAQYEAVIIEAAITMLNRVGISGAQAQKMHNPQPAQAAQPDCRTCFYGDTPDEFNEYQWKCLSLSKVCINGNRYKPFERVVLWRTEP